ADCRRRQEDDRGEAMIKSSSPWRAMGSHGQDSFRASSRLRTVLHGSPWPSMVNALSRGDRVRSMLIAALVTTALATAAAHTSSQSQRDAGSPNPAQPAS